MEPEKPFACTLSDCGMTFTNEDHLNVHIKKHDMVLQLGSEQKAAFVADQTPTPTRFIRNCEEVGLFQDLQNVTVNPFDEGFKQAMETKQGILSLEAVIAKSASDDGLHTPQLVFPLDEDTTLYAQRNIISRSSSNESGTIKASVSKLANEVTTITRVVESTDTSKITNEISNNTVKTINVTKDVQVTKDKFNLQTHTEIRKDTKSLIVFNKVSDKIPLISQKSLDVIVDNFTNEDKTVSIETVIPKSVTKNSNNLKNLTNGKIVRKTRNFVPKILPKTREMCKTETLDDYEVFIKLPNGKQMRMKPVEAVIEEKKGINTKELIRKNLITKHTKNIKKHIESPVVTNILNIPSGTLIPVKLVNHEGAPLSNDDLSKVPIRKLDNSIPSKISIHNIPTINYNIINPKMVDSKVKLLKETLVSVPQKVTHSSIPIAPKVTNTVLTTVTEPNINAVPKIQDQLITKSILIPVTTAVNNIIGTEVINNEVIVPNQDTASKSDSRVASNNIIKENNMKDVFYTRNSVLTKANNTRESSDDDCCIEKVTNKPESLKRTKFELQRRGAASKRYRERLKAAMRVQAQENRKLQEANTKLMFEKAMLKQIISEHMTQCPNSEEFRKLCNNTFLYHGVEC